MSDTPPIRLSNIEFQHIVGEGGFGRVWKARQQDIDRTVAIKVGHAPLLSEAAKTRFRRECTALGRLTDHPGIVDIYTSGVASNGYPYLITEFADGGTLEDRSDDFTEGELLDTGIELCDAVSAAHELKILHRDLKPANVLLRSCGRSVVGDFGIAKLYADADTSTQNLVTTVAFASPEVLEGQGASEATDVYGIAVTLAATALGRSPFISEDELGTASIIRRVLTEPPIDIASTSMSEELLALLTEGMAKDPAERPPNAASFKRRLEHLRDGSTTTNEIAPPSKAAGTARNRTPHPAHPKATITGERPRATGRKRRLILGAIAAAAFLILVTVIATRVLNTGSTSESIRADTTIGSEPSPVTEVAPGQPNPGQPDDSTPENGPPSEPKPTDEVAGPEATTTSTTTEIDGTTTPTETTGPQPTTPGNGLQPRPPVVPVSGDLIEPSNQTVDLAFGPGVTSVHKRGKLQGDEIHSFFFEAQAGQQLDIQFTGPTPRQDIRYTLFIPNNNNRLVTNRSSPLSVFAPTTGRYRIEVRPFTGTPGEYKIQVSIRNNNG